MAATTTRPTPSYTTLRDVTTPDRVRRNRYFFARKARGRLLAALVDRAGDCCSALAVRCPQCRRVWTQRDTVRRAIGDDDVAVLASTWVAGSATGRPFTNTRNGVSPVAFSPPTWSEPNPTPQTVKRFSSVAVNGRPASMWITPLWSCVWSAVSTCWRSLTPMFAATGTKIPLS